jgi:hypothetical protein
MNQDDHCLRRRLGAFAVLSAAAGAASAAALILAAPAFADPTDDAVAAASTTGGGGGTTEDQILNGLISTDAGPNATADEAVITDALSGYPGGVNGGVGTAEEAFLVHDGAALQSLIFLDNGFVEHGASAFATDLDALLFGLPAFGGLPDFGGIADLSGLVP